MLFHFVFESNKKRNHRVGLKENINNNMSKFSSSQGFVVGSNKNSFKSRRSNVAPSRHMSSSTTNDGGGGGVPRLPHDFQGSTYCFGGVTYQYQQRSNGHEYSKGQSKKMSNLKSKDFDPFFDRGKLRTKRVRNSIENEDFERRSSTVHGLLKVLAAPVLNQDLAKRYKYPSLRIFELALELYNRKGVRKIHKASGENAQESISWFAAWHWESNGGVRAAQQLCVQCRDLGKKKNQIETYYMNKMEVAKCRTILCRTCMGILLKNEIGDCEEKIMEQLKLLRKEQAQINE